MLGLSRRQFIVGTALAPLFAEAYVPVLDANTPDRIALAAVVLGEARGGGRQAMENVASVVMNRFRDGWQPSIASVCMAPWQFSCLNCGDVNRNKLLHMSETDPAFGVALGIADRAIAGEIIDATHGADSYFATSIRPPYWAKAPAYHTVTLWRHSFWRVHPVAPRSAPTASADLTADELNQAELNGLHAGDQWTVPR